MSLNERPLKYYLMLLNRVITRYVGWKKISHVLFGDDW